MLLPKPHLWDLRTDRWQPQIVRNGNAERPLATGFMPLPGFAVFADGAVTEVEGTLMADLAGLPACRTFGRRKNRRLWTRDQRRYRG
jgi:hypothetical protein